MTPGARRATSSATRWQPAREACSNARRQAQARIQSLNAIEIEIEPDELSGLVVPHGELSDEALNGVIEEFVLREGTEYGAADVPLHAKVAQVRTQLQRREAEIVFDARTATVSVVLRDSRRKESR